MFMTWWRYQLCYFIWPKKSYPIQSSQTMMTMMINFCQDEHRRLRGGILWRWRLPGWGWWRLLRRRRWRWRLRVRWWWLLRWRLWGQHAQWDQNLTLGRESQELLRIKDVDDNGVNPKTIPFEFNLVIRYASYIKEVQKFSFKIINVVRGKKQ